jgi:ATP-dependent exoDNAse (exonuclease V) beta subunit
MRFPSVTTMLGAMSDNAWVQEWKDRVGDEEAARVSAVASRRGKNIHKQIEDYLNGELNERKMMPFNAEIFYQMKRKLDTHLTVIHAIEAIMIAQKLGLAGTCDLIGVWDGIPSIIDHKTAKKPKNKEDILSYFLQCTLYSIMYEELTGIRLEQIVILIGIDDEKESQVFVEQRSNYEDLVRDILKQFFHDFGY